jgi:hypothetical protein
MVDGPTGGGRPNAGHAALYAPRRREVTGRPDAKAWDRIPTRSTSTIRMALIDRVEGTDRPGASGRGPVHPDTNCQPVIAT